MNTYSIWVEGWVEFEATSEEEAIDQCKNKYNDLIIRDIENLNEEIEED